MQATRFTAANYARARMGKDGRRVGDVKGHDRETKAGRRKERERGREGKRERRVARNSAGEREGSREIAQKKEREREGSREIACEREGKREREALSRPGIEFAEDLHFVL